MLAHEYTPANIHLISPRWILEKNPDNSEKALANLARIRSGDLTWERRR